MKKTMYILMSIIGLCLVIAQIYLGAQGLIGQYQALGLLAFGLLLFIYFNIKLNKEIDKGKELRSLWRLYKTHNWLVYTMEKQLDDLRWFYKKLWGHDAVVHDYEIMDKTPENLKREVEIMHKMVKNRFRWLGYYEKGGKL